MVPGIQHANDPLAQVCLSTGDALKLLLDIFEKLWKLDPKTQAALLKIRMSTLKRFHAGNSVPHKPDVPFADNGDRLAAPPLRRCRYNRPCPAWLAPMLPWL